MIFSNFKIQRLIALFFAASLLVLANCKRPDEPVDKIGTPVFAIKGTVSGQPLQLTAGVDSFYMFSSYRYDSSEKIFALSGNLKKTNCPKCEAIEVLIYDSLPNNGSSPVNIDLALSKSGYEYYYPSTKIVYKVQYFAEDSNALGAPVVYQWDLDNGFTSTAKNPIVEYDTTDFAPRVALTVTTNTNCVATATNQLDFEKATNTTNTCVPNFTFITYASGDSVRFINLSTGTNYYRWYSGDTAIMPNSNPSPTIKYRNSGTYDVTLVAYCNQVFTDTAYITKKVVLRDPSFECLSRFSYSKPTKDSSGKIQSTIIINYTDKNGELYSSKSNPQPVGSFFNLLSHQPYKNNELGQKTHLLNVRFRCRVYSTTTANFKDIDMPTATIAIAYP